MYSLGPCPLPRQGCIEGTEPDLSRRLPVTRVCQFPPGSDHALAPTACAHSCLLSCRPRDDGSERGERGELAQARRAGRQWGRGANRNLTPRILSHTVCRSVANSHWHVALDHWLEIQMFSGAGQVGSAGCCSKREGVCVAGLGRTSLPYRHSECELFLQSFWAKQNMAAGLIRPAGPWPVTPGQSFRLGKRSHDPLGMGAREPVCLTLPFGLTSLGTSQMAV